MDVSPVIARLQAQLTGFVSISGAADLGAATEGTAGVPAAYVLPLAESGDTPDLTGVYRQRLVQGFAVVLVLANLRDLKGAAAAADLHTKRLAVRAALLGWAPDATNGEPVAFISGRLLSFDQQRLWWTDEFSVMTDYRGA